MTTPSADSTPESLSLSVVMPAYNEGQNLVAVVRQAVDDLEQLGPNPISRFQLVLVDDGSSDETRGLADVLATGDPRIITVHHEENRGIGAALKSGFARASLDHVSFLPADGQVAVAELAKLVPSLLDGADMAVGFFTDRLEIDGVFRVMLSRGLRKVAQLALGFNKRGDGVYIVRRDLLTQLTLRSDTFFVNLELPFRLERAGCRIDRVPVRVQPRRAGASKVLGLRRIAQVGADAIKLRVHLALEDLRPPR